MIRKLAMTGVAALAAFVAAPVASATVGASFSGGTLTVTIAAGGTENAAIACVSGHAQVNGADPVGGAVTCSSITAIALTGDANSNVVELAGLDSGGFSSLDTSVLDGGAGTDLIRVVGSNTPGWYSGILQSSATPPSYSNGIAVEAGTFSAFFQLTGFESGRIDGGSAGDAIEIYAGAWTLTGGGGDDHFHLAGIGSGGVAIDGQGGYDVYDATFGGGLTGKPVWSGNVTIADSGGATAESGQLVYSDCAGSGYVEGPPIVVSNSGQQVTATGLEFAVCTLPPTPQWPLCATPAAQNCVVSLELGADEGHLSPAPSYLVPMVRVQGGFLQMNVTRNDTALQPWDEDLTHGPSPLGPTSVLRLTLNTGAIAPGTVYGLANIHSFTYTRSVAAGNTLVITASPSAQSFNYAGCPPPCAPLDDQATVDAGGVFMLAMDAPQVQPGTSAGDVAAQQAFFDHLGGTWVATNAQSRTAPTWDDASNALVIELDGPHLTHAGAVNQGFLTVFLPDALLTEEFGVADPATAASGGVVIEKSESGTTTSVTPSIAHVAAGTAGTTAGILISLPVGSFHYSSPTFAIRKAPAAPANPGAASPASPPASAAGGGQAEPAAPAPTPAAVSAPTPAPAAAQAPAAATLQPELAARVAPTVTLDRPTVRLTVAAPAGATIRAVLLRGGREVAHWTRFATAAGSSTLQLSLPAKARREGTYTLSVTTTSGGQQAAKRYTLRVTR